MMNVFVVDDEPSVREYLLEVLPQLAEDCKVTGIAGSIREAVPLLRQNTSDILLLDVKLSDGLSFEILKQLPELAAHVIFITAYDKFALKAIKFSALDYLLKPIDDDELLKALEKARLRKQREDMKKRLQVLNENIGTAVGAVKRLVLKDAANIFLVKTNEIIRLEAEGGYTCFHLSDGRKLLITKTLKSYSEVLEDEGFFRVHHAHLVNLNFIERIDKTQGLTIFTEDGSQIPISVRKKDKLLRALRKL